jgi:hypothetical protein
MDWPPSPGHDMDVDQLENTTSKGKGKGRQLPSQTRKSERRTTKLNSDPLKNDNAKMALRKRHAKKPSVPEKDSNLRPRDGVISFIEGDVNFFNSCFPTNPQRQCFTVYCKTSFIVFTGSGCALVSLLLDCLLTFSKLMSGPTLTLYGPQEDSTVIKYEFKCPKTTVG